MERHFRLLVEDRSERFGCLLFRKVANWYCRVLRPGRDIQQRLVRVATVQDFADILTLIRERAARWDGREWLSAEYSIPVPKGPIERW
jgi:hypothetical protein